MQFIRDAQSAGLKLAEIGRVLEVRDSGRPPCAEVTALIEQHLRTVEQRLTELRAARENLRELAARAADADPAACTASAICTILTEA